MNLAGCNIVGDFRVNEIAYEPARPQHQSTDVVKGLLYNIPERYAEYNQTGRKPGTQPDSVPV